MSEKEQVQHLANDLENLIDRYRQEYEITSSSVVGVLEFMKHQILKEVFDDEE